MLAFVPIVRGASPLNVHREGQKLGPKLNQKRRAKFAPSSLWSQGLLPEKGGGIRGSEREIRFSPVYCNTVCRLFETTHMEIVRVLDRFLLRFALCGTGYAN